MRRDTGARLLVAALILGSATVAVGTAGTGDSAAFAAPAATHGSVWSSTEAPLPTNASTQPSTRSPLLIGPPVCPAPGSCVIGGNYLDTSGNAQGLVETGAGASWTATEVARPADSSVPNRNAFLADISCPAVGSCIALANYTDTGGNEVALIESLAGGTWTATVVPYPSNVAVSPSYEFLQRIACPALGSCVAFGDYFDTNGNLQGLIETQTQGTWTETEAPLPANAGPFPGGSLETLTCPSVNSCVATGAYEDTGGNVQGLIEVLSQGTWTATEAPLPMDAATTHQSTSFKDVSCPAVTSCVAVGVYIDTAGDGEGLVETLSQGTWTATKMPVPANAEAGILDVFPDTVSCEAVNACVIVGRYFIAANDEQGLIVTLAGGTWSPEQAPRSTKATDLLLASGACASVNSCVGVGQIIHRQDLAIIETMARGTWYSRTAPLPADAATTRQEAFLYEIDCPAVRTCVAVGAYLDTGRDYHGLIDTLSPRSASSRGR
ncbi:MAG TPA: hypothetical protein VN799_01415 [Acidimicrobiales bacterium]|nr:hypothetical protein [Acidimicrobiales bacterium]